MILCKNHNDEVPGCLGIADDRYTMDYRDVEGGSKIYWCSNCGPKACDLEEAIYKAFEDDPSFEEKFRKAIEKAEKDEH